MTHCPQTQDVVYAGVGMTGDLTGGIRSTHPAWRESDLGHLTPTRVAAVVPNQAYGLRPVTWPAAYASDLAIGYPPLGGVAFPGGIVGISPFGLTYDVDPIPSLSLIAVPQTLTAGYTLNKDNATWNGGQGYDSAVPATRDQLLRYAHFRRDGQICPYLRGQSAWVMGANGFEDVYPLVNGEPNDFPRLLLPDGGLWDHRWGPMNRDQGFWNTQDTSVLTMHPGDTKVSNTGNTLRHVGWRNVRAYVTVAYSSGVVTDPTFSRCQLKLKRNTDWGFGASPGTTISTTDLVLVHTDTVGHVAYYQVDVANVFPPDGTLGVIYASIEMDKAAAPLYDMTVSTRFVMFSPRVDLSMPWTIAGFWRDADWVVPGGYNPAIIAAPNLRPPLALTNVYQTPNPRINGDNTRLLCSFNLPPGTYTLETSSAAGWAFVTCLDPLDQPVAVSSFATSASLNVVNGGLHAMLMTLDTSFSPTPQPPLRIN